MSKKQKSKTTRATTHLHCGCMEFIHPSATKVSIAGSFNDLHPQVTPMILRRDGKWAKELALPPGRYEYRLVVDGQWVDDPAAKESVPNPFGGLNAVLAVVDSPIKQETNSSAKAKPRSAPRSA